MKEYYYQQEIICSKEMFNENKCLSNKSILDLFQIVAGNHAKQLNIDYIALNKRNLMWVVVRNRYEIVRQPKINEVVKVVTWPHKAKRIDYDREYLILDENGNVCIKGDSKWCILDQNSKRITMVNDILTTGEFVQNHNFDTPLVQIPNKDFSNIKAEYHFTITKDQIDQNNHLNNAQYAYMIDECLKSYPHILTRFEINFVKETKLNDTLDFKIIEEDHKIYVEGSLNGVTHVKALGVF